jgi:hypothetical protein
MNERIVKLSTEAENYACTVAEKYVPECGEISYLWEHTFRKKFAELIVLECAKACEKNSYLALNGWQRAKQIKEHFGVEE